LRIVVGNRHKHVPDTIGDGVRAVRSSALIQTIGGDDVPAKQVGDEAVITLEAVTDDFQRPCSDVRSNRHEARESGTNSGINDCYSTTSRNVSLIEGKLHLAEVIERHNAIGVIRNNLVGKA